MKKILLALLIVSTRIITFAQTNVTGMITVNTVWDSINDPYIIASNVLVVGGVKLTILPGTVIKFNSQKALQVDGELNVLGTDDARVTFTANTTNPTAGFWDAVIVASGTNASEVDSLGNYVSGNIVRNADFRYGGYVTTENYSAMLECRYTNLYLEKCSFKKSASFGISFNSYGSNSSKHTYIKENQIDSCDVFLQAHGPQISIISNKFNFGYLTLNGGFNFNVENNICRNSLGIRCTGVGAGTVNKNVIINTVVAGGGISLTNSNPSYYNLVYGNLIITKGGMTCTKNISNNVFIGTKGAVSTDYSPTYPIYLKNNQFIECNSTNNVQGGLLFELEGYPSVSFYFKNNLFENNIVPIDFGIIQHINTYSYATNLSNNNFFDNQATYLFKNLNPLLDVNAQNNYWETTNTSIIDQKIYDWYDNASVSFVNYSPILMSPDTIAPISRPKIKSLSKSCDGTVLSWNDNLEQDTKGYKIYYGNFNGYQFENVIDLGNVNHFSYSNLSNYDTIAITAYDHAADGVDDLIDGNESWFRFLYFNNATKLLNLNALNPNVKFCEGESITINASNNFQSYLWSTGATTPTITTSVPGTYHVTVIDSIGIQYCDSIMVQWQNINLNLGPDASIVPGQSFVLIANAPGSQFLWSDGSTGNQLTVDTIGTYWVKVTSTLGCVFYDTINVSFNLINIDEVDLNKIIAYYPNPANNEINIDLKGSYKQINIKINDVVGKQLFIENYKNKNALKINLEQFTKGIYLVEIVADNQHAVLKIIKE